MRARMILAMALAFALPTAVDAADAPVPVPASGALPLMTSAPLPSMALDPQVPESLYHGLYVGTEIFGVAGHGIKGGVGGDVFAGYDRVLDNDVLVGFQGTTGYASSILGRPGLKGFDFGEASAELGYAMGRFTPFVTGGPRRGAAGDRRRPGHEQYGFVQRPPERIVESHRGAADWRRRFLCVDQQHERGLRRIDRPRRGRRMAVTPFSVRSG